MLLVFLFSWDVNYVRYVNIYIVLYLGWLFLGSLKARSLYVPSFCKILLLFVGWCFLSCIWAINRNSSFSKSITLIELIILTIFMFDYIIKNDKSDIYMRLFCWSGAVLSIYIFFYYGPSKFIQLLLVGERIGTDVLNVNVLGTLAALSALIAFYIILSEKNYKYVVFVVVNTLAVAGSGSRKAFVMLPLGVTMILFALVFANKGGKKRKYFLALLGVLIVFFFLLQTELLNEYKNRVMQMLYSFFDNSSTYSASNLSDHSSWVRKQLREIGFLIFKDHPIGGIGIDNARFVSQQYGFGDGTYYLHCNYVELLSGIGIIGTVIYYLLYFVPLKLFVSRKHDQKCLFFAVLIILKLIVDYGMVSYYSKETYLFFLLIWTLYIRIKWSDEKSWK